MKWLNRISIVVLMGFSILICFQSIKLGIGTLSNMGPGFMPLIVSILLFSLSMLVFITEIKRTGEEKKTSTDAKNFLKPIGFVVALFAYMFLLNLVGYLIVTFCLMFFMFVVSYPKKWCWYILLSGVVTILSFLLFDTLLRLHLPRGIFYIG